LDIRTKHTIAQDRLIVAEQRLLEAERRKSANNLQLLAFEQKQVEKKLASLHTQLASSLLNRPLGMRSRSTSEVMLSQTRRSSSWNETLFRDHVKLSISLNNSNHHLLTLPKLGNDMRRLSTYSDGDIPDQNFFTSDLDSGEDDLEQSTPRSQRSSISFEAGHLKSTASTRRKTITKSNDKPRKPLPPLLAVIPPDEDVLFLLR
jgi:hypothetical protein